MISSMDIAKFKAFNSTQHAELKPITLIYGANSAGKSSFIQSNLLLKQSINEYGLDNTALIPKGKFIDLGSYKEMVYDHDDKSNIKICHELTLTNRINVLYRRWKKNIQKIKYESIFSCDESRRIILDEINLYYNGVKEPFIKLSRNKNGKNPKAIAMRRMIASKKINKDNFPNLMIEYINKQHPLFNNIYELYSKSKEESTSIDLFYEELIKKIQYIAIDIDSFLISGVGVVAYHLDEDEDLFNILDDVRKSKIEELIMMTGMVYRDYLESIVYLGPLRDYPERHYIFSGTSPLNVGKSGKYTNDLLFTDQSLISKVNEWLERFNINYEMSIDEFKSQTMSDVYSMRLIDKVSNVNVSPLDVGFGISQILPIIVQSIISRRSVICIEQPEIHIHPRLQAELGTFFSECIRQKNQFIIETHSEHLMLRIQRLIRNGELSNEDVSVIYIDRQEDGSKCIELRLDEDGDFIDEWPHGFFEEGYEEIF